MKILTAGHLYVLENFDHPENQPQFLQFIHKAPSQDDSTEFETVTDGTTNEEVIRVLIDRLSFQYKKFPSVETYSAVKSLQLALESLEARTKNRQSRGVEGKNIK